MRHIMSALLLVSGLTNIANILLVRNLRAQIIEGHAREARITDLWLRCGEALKKARAQAKKPRHTVTVTMENNVVYCGQEKCDAPLITIDGPEFEEAVVQVFAIQKGGQPRLVDCSKVRRGKWMEGQQNND